MSRWLVLLLLVPLGACIEQEQAAQLSTCQRDTQPIGYPTDMRGIGADKSLLN